MWRRACMGDRSALGSLLLVVLGIGGLTLLLVAARLGVLRALEVAAICGTALAATYTIRRQQWNRRFRAEGGEVVARFEALLWRPDDHAE